MENNTNKTKEIFQLWLQFGSVFLIYRLGNYLIDKQKHHFWDRDSLQLGIFVLLGFTLYHLLVQPFVPINDSKPVLKEISNDVLFLGTGLLTANILYALVNNIQVDNHNLKLIVYVLFGVMVYDVLFFSTILKKTDKPLSNATVDITKYGTIMFISQILVDKSFRTVMSVEWLTNLLLMAVGFLFYNVVIKPRVIII
jgi:hypothetical protein